MVPNIIVVTNNADEYNFLEDKPKNVFFIDIALHSLFKYL